MLSIIAYLVSLAVIVWMFRAMWKMDERVKK
jgi:hypothetical protein